MACDPSEIRACDRTGSEDVSTSDSDRRIKKQVNLDGVRYDITVSTVSDGIYRATWKCSECHEEGAWSPLSGDPVQAVHMAQVGIQVHHSLLHQHGSKVPKRPR